MRNYQFTLIVGGADIGTSAAADALFEAGCDDATISSVDGIQFLDFDREALGATAAVLSAIESIEGAVQGARVVRIADGGFVSMTDIAARTNRTRESVRLLVSGARGPGQFPAPVTDPRSRYRLWRWNDVQQWFALSLAEPISDPDLATFGVVNAALTVRSATADLPEIDRRRLQQLAGLTV